MPPITHLHETTTNPHLEQHLVVAEPPAAEPFEDSSLLITNLRSLPHARHAAETDNGIIEDIDVRLLPLDNPQGFRIAHRLAAWEPVVYARQGNNPAVMGMMSANFDNQTDMRSNDIRIIPLLRPRPLTAEGKPHAESAIMLAGAVMLERAGVGLDQPGVAMAEPEHKLTLSGALSLDNPAIAIAHRNHDIRQAGGSTAQALTSGDLGTLYAADNAQYGFNGYGEPLVFRLGQTQPNDMLMIPDSTLGEGEYWGSSPAMAEVSPLRVMHGAGLHILGQRTGAMEAVADRLRRLADQVPDHAPGNSYGN